MSQRFVHQNQGTCSSSVEFIIDEGRIRSVSFRGGCNGNLQGISRLVGDLNALYRNTRALHADDFTPQGFRWIDCDDRDHSRVAFERRAGDDVAVVVLNFTPVPRDRWRVGLPRGGEWREVLNTDSERYGGANLGNAARVHTDRIPAMGREFSTELLLPPLGALVLVPA